MIYLLHIPKTGGQTLALRLAPGFPPGRVSILQADIADTAALTRLAAENDFFEGHPGRGVLADPPAGLRVMTAVRDPFEHAVSHYRHIRRDATHPLSAAALALPPAVFLDRFTPQMTNFQAHTLVTAFRVPSLVDRVRGLESWLLRHLEEAIQQLTWAVPSDQLDDFCALWSLEGGRRAQGDPTLRVNVASPDDGADLAVLRRWCAANPERFAVDLVLWAAVRRRHAEWRHALLTRDATGEAPPGLAPWSEGEAAIWLLRDWHPPVRRHDGETEWWAGPGPFPLLRLRRGGRSLLRFEALSMLGVRWDHIRLLRRADLAELPVRRAPDAASGIVSFECVITSLGEDEEILLYGLEDIGVLPALPLAWEVPRRSFATQRWRLA